ncbi:MAG: transcriptional repressor LexA [Desulfomonilaceae bacterium]
MTITERQKQILDFINLFQKHEGFPPSLREICKGIGLASHGSLIKHIRSLESQGLIKGMPGKKRAWKLVDLQPMQIPSIPVLGQIAAGNPILAHEDKGEHLPINPSFFGSSEAFALRVKGDSMIEAHIQDGDLAIIRPQQEAENGSIFAVIVETVEPEATLKILKIIKNTIELRPANELYKPLIFRGKNRSKIKVLGKLIGVIRDKP